MNRGILNPVKTKDKFQQHIYDLLMEALNSKGLSDQKEYFQVEGPGIMCYLLSGYFDDVIAAVAMYSYKPWDTKGVLRTFTYEKIVVI